MRSAAATTLLIAASLSGRAGAKEGFIKKTDSNEYLTCDTSNCKWSSSPSQVFRMDTGEDGQHRFHILGTAGQDLGQCLDREHCHSSSSNSRMSDCNHCGAVHWQYDGSRLAEDDMSNCIQSDGSVAHCDQSHQPITWPYKPDCKIKEQHIKNLRCASSTTGGECGASFERDSVTGAHSEQDCNACKAPEGSTLSCDFNLGVTTSNTLETTFSSASSAGIEYGLQFDAGLIFADVKESVKFSVSETLTVGKSKTVSRSTTVQSGCSATIQAGTAAVAEANVLVGRLTGSFVADVVTTWDCAYKPTSTETTSGTMTISNVPTDSIDGSCTVEKEACPAFS